MSGELLAVISLLRSAGRIFGSSANVYCGDTFSNVFKTCKEFRNLDSTMPNDPQQYVSCLFNSNMIGHLCGLSGKHFIISDYFVTWFCTLKLTGPTYTAAESLASGANKRFRAERIWTMAPLGSVAPSLRSPSPPVCTINLHRLYFSPSQPDHVEAKLVSTQIGCPATAQ